METGQTGKRNRPEDLPPSRGTGLRIYRTSRCSYVSHLRVRVWRKLRSLVALYLQQSVCLLPAREPVRRQVRRLLASVRADGGTARSLTVMVDDAAEYAGLVAEFNAERDAEYAE